MAHVLLKTLPMKPKTHSQGADREVRANQTVLIIGGSGGMTERYRDVVEERGWSVRHYENRVPPGVRRGAGRIALVVIMVSMVSHSLLQQVRSLSIDDAPVIYLRSASVSALRSAVERCAV
ncbi:MAG TPA: DUF2325 domain-containing protein [Polyangiaceae bacterium]|nr:DUF2325 domain-containing protein [Polyangiaceae bacterium]